MTTELLRLRDEPHARRALPALARTRHLHLRLGALQPAPEGFVRGVSAINLWTSTSAPVRASVEHATGGWLDAGVEFALFDVASFGVERLVESIYFRLLVPCSYCLGDATFPMNVDTLRRLATPDVLIAVALLDGREVAASLFQPSRRTPRERYSATELADGGLDLVASAVEDSRFADAFFYASLAMLEAHGIGAVRVRRSPWVTPRDAPAWARDLGRAERLAWEERDPADYFFWQPLAFGRNEGVLGFRVAPRGIEAYSLGSQTEAMVTVERRLGELLRGALGGQP